MNRDVLRERILDALSRVPSGERGLSLSDLGYAVYVERQRERPFRRAQGAALAAARLVSDLRKEGLLREALHDWHGVYGYEITREGRVALAATRQRKETHHV